MHKLTAASIAMIMLAVSSHDARAVTQTVKDACRDDYLAYCAAHEVGSDALRDCMADAFDKLSPACVAAIMDSEAANEHATAPERSKRVAHKKHHRRLASPLSRGKRYVRHARRLITSVVHRIRHALR
jgi:hypothetical protein